MNKEFIDKYLQETNEIICNIDREELNKFIDILFGIWKSGKKVITMGNGGSASSASHFAADLLKTVANTSSDKDILDSKRGFKAICLNDNPAVLTAWINDSGWDKSYSGLLNTFLEEGDSILIISVHGGSGWSGNIVEAMNLARKRNAKILGLAGFDGGKLKELADSCIVVPKDSTPHTEGFHGVIQHLIIWRLKELIEKELNSPSTSDIDKLKEKISDSFIRERLTDMIKQCNPSKSKIKFFADTASIEEIDYCFSKGVNDGITTNPKIIELTGDCSLSFEEACKAILKKYPQVPVSLETDLRGINLSEINKKPEQVRDSLLRQAEEVSKWGSNVVIKIPVSGGGLMAVRVLSQKGIKTNVTACMTPYQALRAAEAGATYVSLFANRMLDAHILELSGNSLERINKFPNWKEIIKQNKNKYFEEAWKITLDEIAYVAEKLDGTSSQLIVGSIREPADIYRIVKASPQIITIPFSIVQQLQDISSLKETKRSLEINNGIILGNSICHPLTHQTLEEFEKSAISVSRR